MEEQIITIDRSRQIRVWKSAQDLHIGEYAGDGRGGWTATNTLTLPMAGEMVAEVLQAIMRAIK